VRGDGQLPRLLLAATLEGTDRVSSKTVENLDKQRPKVSPEEEEEDQFGSPFFSAITSRCDVTLLLLLLDNPHH